MSIAAALGPLRASAVVRRIARGTMWLFVGLIASRGLTVLSYTLVARVIGAAEFGKLGIIQSTVAMFQVFATFGLGTTATKYVAEYRTADPSRAGSTIVFTRRFAALTGALGAVVLLLIAPWLAARVLAAPSLTGLLRLASPLLILTSVNGCQIGALSGFEDFKRIARINVAVGVLTVPAILYGVYEYGLAGAICAQIASSSTNFALSYWAVRSAARTAGVPLRVIGDRHDTRIFCRFTIPSAMAGSLVAPVTWICTALLVNQRNGYGEMGIFNAANQWYTALLFLPGILGQVLMPVLSERISVAGTEASARLLHRSIIALAVMFAPVALIGCLMSPLIMRAYGPDFASHWSTLAVIFATGFVLAVQTPVGNFISASGQMWVGFAMNAGWAIATLGFTFALVSRGALGVASARLAGYAIHACWTFAFAYWYVRQRAVPPTTLQTEEVCTL